ncbi:MAG: D-aminoacyl-tRNA deacylase [Ignavibacteriae bacterium]|nr:D-aminoacyl-tRNA deacylase [Ignavibacteriota bacterium]
MRALVQRVKRCSVTINGSLHSEIGAGMLILLGVKQGDTSTDAQYLAERCLNLRIFDDTDGKMNLSVRDAGGSVMVVSQFTLYGDTRKGNRPSYAEAAPPQDAERLYDEFTNHLRGVLGSGRVASGVFRAMMDVVLVNDGPVTLLLESKTRTDRDAT